MWVSGRRLEEATRPESLLSTRLTDLWPGDASRLLVKIEWLSGNLSASGRRTCPSFPLLLPRNNGRTTSLSLSVGESNQGTNSPGNKLLACPFLPQTKWNRPSTLPQREFCWANLFPLNQWPLRDLLFSPPPLLSAN